MDVLEVLRADHEKMRDYFDQARAMDNIESKRDLFERVKDELDLHSHLEETIFYPALQASPELRPLLEECYDEHQEITDLLEEIDESDDEEPALFEDDFEELMESVEFHFRREETVLFPEAQRVLDASRLQALGAVLGESREKLAAA